MGVVAAKMRDWSDADHEAIRKLWSEGASASEIATAIGQGVTRNAVIGKVARLKLPSHGSGHRRGVGNPGQPKAAAIRARTAARGKGQTKALTIAHRLNSPAPFRPGVLPVGEELPDVTHLVGIMELTAQTCRFPIGDPKEPGFGYCGCVPLKGSVYCPSHDARAYHKL